MKLRYKIFLVIGGTVAVYFLLMPAAMLCFEISDNCDVMTNLVTLTRPVIPASMFGSEDGIGEWSGTPQGIEMHPSGLEMLDNFTKFIFSMIVLPSLIIFAILMWEKRQNVSRIWIIGASALIFGLANVFASVFHTVTIFNSPFPFMHRIIEFHENGLGVRPIHDTIEAAAFDPYWLVWSFSLYAGIILLGISMAKSQNRSKKGIWNK